MVTRSSAASGSTGQPDGSAGAHLEAMAWIMSRPLAGGLQLP
jgi:hypothetical protein